MKNPVSIEIDDIIAKHGGWKADVLTQLRNIITSAEPSLTEEVKWKMPTRPEGLPVWSSNGIVCFAEIWNDNIKVLFPLGAKLADPQKLFNARLKGDKIRAIELHENDVINDSALQELVRAAVQLNATKPSK